VVGTRRDVVEGGVLGTRGIYMLEKFSEKRPDGATGYLPHDRIIFLAIGAQHPGMVLCAALPESDPLCVQSVPTTTELVKLNDLQGYVPNTIGHSMTTPWTSNRAKGPSCQPIFGRRTGRPKPQCRGSEI